MTRKQYWKNGLGVSAWQHCEALALGVLKDSCYPKGECKNTLFIGFSNKQGVWYNDKKCSC